MLSNITLRAFLLPDLDQLIKPVDVMHNSVL